ncbi:phage terminase large subunit [Castellaniella sp.]|uniref:phage terminase large subunit n=1 Tax=Castellaniella sp. TaxID=1955812 RepID=UPI002AFE7526|nr:phage terminase large subunit [Castellaniella sp.]
MSSSPVSTRSHLLSSTSKTNPDPLKADFRNFLWLIWQHLNLPEPTPVQYDIASYLQHGPRRLVIEAFRGVGKSWITSAFVCWLLYCNPQLKIMVVSASKARSDQFSVFTLRLIREVDILRFLEPRAGQRESTVAFDVGPARPDHSPSVKSVGITGQLTGSRADVIVADDIEVVNNSSTQAQRDKLAEIVKEFDAILKPGGRVIYLGTPQTEQSLYNALPERGYVIRIWPARYLLPEKRERYGAKLAPFISDAQDADQSLAGLPTDPKRFSHDDLMEREASYGRSGFALQFQLDTSLSDADRYPLKLSDLVVMPLDPYRGPTDLVWVSGTQNALQDLPAVGLSGDRYHAPAWTSGAFEQWEGSAMFIDPSGRGKDETAYVVVKTLHGRMFLTAAGGLKGGYDEETLKSILMVAKKHEVNIILAEPNFGGGMFTALLKGVSQQVYPVKIEDAEWSRTQKEARIIDTLEPVMNQHRLIVCPSVIEQDYKSTETYTVEEQQAYRLFYQMTRLTADRGSLGHDDRLDALAGAVAYWTKVMSRDTERAALDQKERLQDAEIERFLEKAHIPGHSPGGEERWSSRLMGR